MAARGAATTLPFPGVANPLAFLRVTRRSQPALLLAAPCSTSSSELPVLTLFTKARLVNVFFSPKGGLITLIDQYPIDSCLGQPKTISTKDQHSATVSGLGNN